MASMANTEASEGENGGGRSKGATPTAAKPTETRARRVQPGALNEMEQTDVIKRPLFIWWPNAAHGVEKTFH